MDIRMLEDDYFLRQIGSTIQSWLSVETQLYLIYGTLMKGAKSSLVSVSFHHIQSFDSKTILTDTCLTLLYDRENPIMITWKNLRNRMEKLNKKRNKIVHSPVIHRVKNGDSELFLGASYFDATAVAKKTAENPEHEYDVLKLQKIETDFKAMSQELAVFRKSLAATMAK